MEEEQMKSNILVELKHVAVCTNKCPQCLSWGSNDLIAMGSSSTVVICQNKCKKDATTFKSAIKTLSRHTGRVNCVRWVSDMINKTEISSATSYLLSGSTDKTIIVWKIFFSAKLNEYIFDTVKCLKGHTAAVTDVDGLLFYQSSNQSPRAIVVSTSVDLTVHVWRSSTSSDPKDIELMQKIDFQHCLVLTISLHLLPDRTPILACGLDNFGIDLYCITEQVVSQQEGDSMSDEFSMMLTLPGHEDWVRGSDFLTVENSDLLLATCSQDCFIRLWRISKQKEITNMEENSDVLKLREMKFTTRTQDGESTYIVQLEAVLSGHEGWVYSVQWSRCNKGNVRLLSASMDKSVIIWEMDEESGIWIEKFRFGEVGGNTLGFYGARFNSLGTQVVAHSYNGALHVWEEINPGTDENHWNTGVTMSGHFGPVLDISWEPKHGRYFVSTSTDQTTRLFAAWKRNGQNSWHEIARPQIHGYDMQCLAMIDSCRFISGADEKVLRVFEAPQNFLQNLEKLSGSKVEMTGKAAEGASIPALGLSNKAVFSSKIALTEETPTSRGEQYIENQFKSLVLQQPPSEEHLLQNSLWPETNKLYWHVYEIFCVASNSLGTLVASAAKSATPQHATIVLWSTETWKDVAQLHAHTLTVTQMEFSNDGRFLLSVSRDRTWILHKISGDLTVGYSVVLFAKSDKRTCHSRIIWSASWTHDDIIFCTGSRDKKIMFWKINEDRQDEYEPNASLIMDHVSRVHVTNTPEAITAVAFATKSTEPSEYLLAVGKESGLLELHLFIMSSNEYSCVLLYNFSINYSHAATVKRIRWRPTGSSVENDENEQWIATCSADHLIKLFSVTINIKTSTIHE